MTGTLCNLVTNNEELMKIYSHDRIMATQYLLKYAKKTESEGLTELYKIGVNNFKNDELIILKSSKNIFNTYTQECNGLILEKENYDPIVVPSRRLRTQYNIEEINKFLQLGLYKIFLVEDGTTINLYYRNEWIISTFRGINMNNVKWDLNKKTYLEMFKECLEQYNLTWELFTNALEKKYSYTFGFKHPDIHKFKEGNNTFIYKIWFIQYVNLDKNSENYLWSNEESPILIIPSQKQLKERIDNVKYLMTKCNNSLNNFVQNKEICYGFILRTVNFEATGTHSDILIESSLMKSIKDYWYNTDLNVHCANKNLPKDKIIVLDAFLSDSKSFIHLFPEYTILHQKYNQIINTLAEYVTNNLLKDKRKTNANLNIELFRNKELFDSCVDDLERCILSEINMNFTNAQYEELKKIVLSFIKHPKSLIYLSRFI
jgi:hypothetical protein